MKRKMITNLEAVMHYFVTFNASRMQILHILYASDGKCFLDYYKYIYTLVAQVMNVCE